MRPIFPITLGLALCALPACAAARHHDAEMTGALLKAAGFNVAAADGPAPASDLQALPALRMTTRQEGGATIYRLADPYACECVYVGDADAYAEFRTLAQERDMVNTAHTIGVP